MSVSRGDWMMFSGLPRIAGAAPFAVLMTLERLDALVNTRGGGRVEAGIRDLAAMVGMDNEKIRRALERLQELKLVNAFLPDNDEEDCLIEIRWPIPAPTSPEIIRARSRWGDRLPEALRYDGDCPIAGAPDCDGNIPENPRDDDPVPRALDAYINAGMKLNHLTVDLIAALVRHHGGHAVISVIEAAKRENDRDRERKGLEAIQRSMKWIQAELARRAIRRQKLEAER